MIVWLALLLWVGRAAAETPLGVAPVTPWSCPATHPVKGYRSEAGPRIYFLPSSVWYEEASPERCYANESEAVRDGSRPPRWSVPPGRTDDLARLTR